MTETIAGDWLDKTVHIIGSSGQVYFGDTKLPGLIEDNGIVITSGVNDVNRLTITFLVGKVEIEDPLLDEPGHQATLFPRSSDLTEHLSMRLLAPGTLSRWIGLWLGRFSVDLASGPLSVPS